MARRANRRFPKSLRWALSRRFYLSVQLLMFREKMRNIEPMNGMMKGLSDDDLRRMAEALAKLPPPNAAAEPPDPAEPNGRAR